MLKVMPRDHKRLLQAIENSLISGSLIQLKIVDRKKLIGFQNRTKELIGKA